MDGKNGCQYYNESLIHGPPNYASKTSLEYECLDIEKRKKTLVKLELWSKGEVEKET